VSNEAAAEPAGLKVLVIDDSNTIRRSAEIFLKQGGYEVLLAEDGFDALSKVNDHGPDLIFCDILMPRLDGYQTCAIIKRNARFASTPVIMLSSKDGLFDKARGRMVGSEDYLTKPFTKDQLLQAVNQHRRAACCALARTGRAARHRRSASSPWPTEDPPCPFKRSCWSTTRRPSCSTCPICSRSAATRCGWRTTATRRCGG
jgi:twitching motility two-component system response regulator PilG